MQKKVFMGIDGGGTYTRVAITNELVWLGTGGFEKTYAKRMELFANFAKNITDAALSESNLAKKICEQAAIEITTGIKIVGECFESDMIKVALTGSVANSQYIKEQIGKCLLNAKNKSFILAESELQPELGAVVLAMQEMGILLDEKIILNLKNSSKDI